MATKRVDPRGGHRPGVVKQTAKGSTNRFFVLLGLVALVGVIALGTLVARSRANRVVTRDPSLPAVKAEGYVMGSPSAPVEIVEFADFECPGCAQFATLTEPDVRTRLIQTGQARFRFIDLPLDIHRNTLTAHLAAACANDQGKFWPMHDAIFSVQDRWNTQATSDPRDVIDGLAKQVGLDMGAYESCMDSRKHLARIQANAAEAARQNIPSTPTFIIGGKQVNGAIGWDEFKKAVDDAAAAASPAKTAPPAAGTVADTTRR